MRPSFLIARLVSALTTVAVLAVVARTRNAQDLGLVAFGLTVGLRLRRSSRKAGSPLF